MSPAPPYLPPPPIAEYSLAVYEEEEPLNELPLSVEQMKELAKDIASEYDISYEIMDRVVTCESQWVYDAIGDNGNSYGLVQIFMPIWEGEVSIQQAKDPEWSLRFLAKNLSEGNGYLWTCYRKLYSL